jgi:actin-like ATPase involved in cell morphogenesis
VNSATPATVISATPTTVTLVDRRAAKERAENTHATRGR